MAESQSHHVEEPSTHTVRDDSENREKDVENFFYPRRLDVQAIDECIQQVEDIMRSVDTNLYEHVTEWIIRRTKITLLTYLKSRRNKLQFLAELVKSLISLTIHVNIIYCKSLYNALSSALELLATYYFGSCFRPTCADETDGYRHLPLHSADEILADVHAKKAAEILDSAAQDADNFAVQHAIQAGACYQHAHYSNMLHIISSMSFRQ
jgi:hypothetical protein